MTAMGQFPPRHLTERAAALPHKAATPIVRYRGSYGPLPEVRGLFLILIKEAIGNFFLGFFIGAGRYLADHSCCRMTHSPSGERISWCYVGIPQQHLPHHKEQMPWRFGAAGYDFPPIRYLAHRQTYK
jgi:hypothetical protein